MSSRCVARHDHHCIWVNNCVGSNNHRYFILFLLVNFLASLYGTIAVPLFLHGEISHYLYRPLRERATGKFIVLAQHPRRLLELVALRYTSLFTLGCCTAGFTLLLLAFLVYHIYLICVGKTSNELFKWRRLPKEKRGRGSNRYNKGWRQNFMEVLFPIDVNRHLKDL